MRKSYADWAPTCPVDIPFMEGWVLDVACPDCNCWVPVKVDAAAICPCGKNTLTAEVLVNGIDVRIRRT